ncbi:MAG TPA: FtsX-like permease family protein [Actinocrinis sp.]|nr:FtsX-like permease family protein [Actinocrinis sp.]
MANLRLADPAAAPAFEQRFSPGPDATPQNLLAVQSWQDVGQSLGDIAAKQQSLLLVCATLLALFGITSVTVLVGGRLTEQTRRVGLLRAVGATPALVALVLLAENLFLALLAAAAGLLVGWLAAPVVTDPSAGLLGTVGFPPLQAGTVGAVVGLAVLVALAASLLPAVRATRTSLVRAIEDAARAPRRRGLLIALSARLPVPALLGLRMAARRPRRSVLSAISIAITVATIVTVMIAFAGSPGSVVDGFTSPTPPRNLLQEHVILAFTAVLVVLAVINVVFITWTTALDSRRPPAVARALGASPGQVAAGLSAAQLVPALAGSVLGVPLGFGLFAAVNHHGSGLTVPPVWWLAGSVLGVLGLLALLSAIPARITARRSVSGILQTETG